MCGCPISCAPRGGASVVRSASAAAKAFCAVVVGTTANPNKLAVLAILALVVVLVVAAGACELWTCCHWCWRGASAGADLYWRAIS